MDTTTIPRYAPLGETGLRLSSALGNYIEIPDAVWFNGDFTLEGWVYPYENAADMQMLNFAILDETRKNILNNVSLAISDPTGNLLPNMTITKGANSSTVTSFQFIQVQDWSHVAVVLSGAVATIYMNGVAQGTQTSMQAPPDSICNSNFIGLTQGENPVAPNAAYSQIRIWEGALDADQINYYMYKQLTGKVYLTGPDCSTIAKLTGNWQMNEGYGDVVFNRSDKSNATNGVLEGDHNGPPPEWMIISALNPLQQKYLPPSSLSFSNVNQSYVSIPEGVWFEGGDFTIEGWVYVRNYISFARVIDFANGSPSDNVGLAISGNNAGKPVFFTYNGGTGYNLNSTKVIPKNKWVHICATFSGTTGTIYIDGVKSGSADNMPVPNNVTRSTNYIGRSNWFENGYPDAAMRDIRIWRGALTGAQVKEVMNKTLYGPVEFTNNSEQVTATLIANWRLNEGEGNTVQNFASMTNAGMGTLSTTGARLPIWDYQWRQFKSPHFALQFANANKNYVQIPPGVWFDGGDFTIEAWVYVIQVTDYARLIDFGNGAPSDNVGMSISNAMTGNPSLFTSSGVDYKIFQSPESLPLNKWTHLAGTFSASTKTATIYIDGKNTGSLSDMFVPNNIVRNNNYIARSNWAHAGVFPDSVNSEVRIWQGALTQEQILEFMPLSLAGPVEIKNSQNEVTAKLIGNWPLNAGEGDVAKNTASLKNQNNGTLMSENTPPVLPKWIVKCDNYE